MTRRSRLRAAGPVGLEQRVLARLRARGPAAAVILLGFSGGPDSLALAASLAAVAPLAGVSVIALHVDHGLRPESAAEQRRARELAASLGLPFRAVTLTPRAAERHPGVGLEEAARRERFAAFAAAAAAVGTSVVALAHHRDDQAETVLLHLLRGSGLAGAVGMAEWSSLAIPWWTEASDPEPACVTVWRPLLSEPPQALREYLDGRGLVAIADPSNADVVLRRNALRHVALPLLERVSPGAAAALARFGALAGDDEAALSELAERVVGAGGDAAGDLAVDRLRPEPLALRRRAVRRWIERATGYRSLTADRTDAIVALAMEGKGDRVVEIGEGRVVVARRGRLRVGTMDELRRRAREEHPGPLFPPGMTESIPGSIPGAIRVDGWEIAVGLSAAGAEPRAGDGAALREVDGALDVVWRSPRAGDRWAASGRKIGDWLTAAGVAPLIRRDLVCLASGHRVHWIAGLPLPAFERPAGPATADGRRVWVTVRPDAMAT